MTTAMRRLAQHLWCLGFCFVTFDRTLVLEVGNYTLKLSFLFFLIAFVAAVGAELTGGDGLRGLAKRTISILGKPPWALAAALIALASVSFAFAKVPSKAVMYSLWLWFDLFAIVLTAFLAFAVDPNHPEKPAQGLELWMRYMTAAVIGLSLIVHVDYFAHFYGFKSGLIGYNQGDNAWYVNSRPHAFSFEPSYLALFFVFSTFYLAFQAAIAARPMVPRWLAFVALIFCFNTLLFTFARSVLITAAFMLAILAFLLHRTGKLPRLKVWNMIGAVALAIALFVAVTPKSQLQAVYDRMIYRALKGTDGSVDTRIHGVQMAWQMARATNFRGVGLGSSYHFWFYDLGGHTSTYPLKEGETERQKIQNTWLEILAELGFLGFALYLGFALSFVFAAYRAMKRELGGLALVTFASATTFFLFTAHWFPNVCRTDVWVWYAIWGVSIAVPNAAKLDA